MKVRHKQVESWMVDMVRRRLREFDYHGKLDRQHYSFCKTGTVSPFPVYHHLLFCYNRTGRKLQVKVGCSLLFQWQLRRNPGRITYLSKMIACDLSGHSRFKKSRKRFEEKLQDLQETFFPEHTERLVEDQSLVRGMHNLLQGKELPPEYNSKEASDLYLVMKQRGALYGEVAELKLVSQGSEEFLDFMADLVPEKAEVSSGSFTLNAAKASSKMKRFQLSNPQNFVAHLVGGAVCGGATEVTAYIDSDDIIVEFDGAFLGESDLDDLLDSMFNVHASQRLREFCVALNAAQSLKPLALTVESWSGQRGYHLDVVGDGQVSTLDRSPFSEPARAGHRIAFKDRPSLKVVTRFLNSLEVDHPELDILRQRCGLGPVPLWHKGKDCRNMPLSESGWALHWEHSGHPLGDWDLSEISGLRETSPGDFTALFLAGPAPQLQVYVNGVAYEAPLGSQKALPCFCLVVCNSLGRDLSYTGITHDEQWKSVAEHLAMGVERLFTSVLGDYAESEGPQRLALSKFLRDCLHCGFEKAQKHPIFPTLDGHYSAVLTMAQESKVLFTERSWKYPLRSGETVYQLTPEDRDFLARFPDGKFALAEADRELHSSQTYFHKREQWMKLRPAESLELSRPYGPVRDMEKLQGQLGLRRSLSVVAVEPYALGRPLPTYEVPSLPLGLRVIFNHDGLETDDDWTRVLTTEAQDEALSWIKKELHAFYTQLVAAGPRYNNYVLHYLWTSKKAGREWTGLLSKMRFRLLDGTTRTWAELKEDSNWLESFRSGWFKRFHLSRQQRRLLNLLHS